MSVHDLPPKDEIGQLKEKIAKLEAELSKARSEKPITERKRDNRQSYQNQLFEANHFAIVLYDFDQEELIDCNDKMLSLYGHDKKETLIGMNYRDLIPRFSGYSPGLDNYFAVEQHSKRVREGESFQSVIVLTKKDKTHLLLNMTIIPVHPGKGLSFIMFEESNDKKNSQRLLEKSEESYRNLFENSYEGIVYFDLLEKRTLDCNQKALELYGFKSKEELLNTPSSELYAGNREDGVAIKMKLINMLENVFENGQAVSSHWAKKITGERFRIRINAVLENSSKKHPRCLFFIRDITPQYLAQKEKNRLINELQQIITTMPATLMIKNEFGKVIRSNKMVKVGREDGIDILEEVDMGIQCNLNQKRDLQQDLEVIKTGQAQIGVVEKVEDHLGLDHWVRSDKIPYRNEDGEIKGVMIYSVDVSEMIEAREKIETQNIDLKRYIDSNNQLENFAYIASHDLQAPLRSIISFTQLLNRSFKEELRSDQKDYIDFIISAGKNMQKLITSLLVYSRVKETDQTIEEIDALDLLKTIRRELVSVIDEKKALVQFENIPATINGDIINIRQLFQNLITNALKFIPDGTSPEIWVRGKEKPQHWQFEVSDNGIGIAKKDQKGIFKLFHRLHGKSEYEGSGIGLALCQKIVSAHLGEIWLESTVGQGTTFYFTISKKLVQSKK